MYPPTLLKVIPIKTRIAPITLALALALSIVTVLWLGLDVAAAGNTWSPGASMSVPRDGHTSTLLNDGKVLIVGGRSGGTPLASAEVYDPATNGWTSAGVLAYARFVATATRLADGRVLVVGGISSSGSYPTAAELYDPVSNQWSSAGTLAEPRAGHTATLLPSGKVLVAGGANSVFLLASAELYDPTTNAWTAAASMSTYRNSSTAKLLGNGKVLIAGGNGAGDLSSAELYDPVGNSWSAAASMSTPRIDFASTLLANGKVLVMGGFPSIGSAEIYDPTTNGWTSANSMASGRRSATATLLPNGLVLVTGGTSTNAGSTELYHPDTNIWTGAASMAYGRTFNAASLLGDGRVLITGGYGPDPSGAEIYQPVNPLDPTLTPFPTSTAIPPGAIARISVASDGSEANDSSGGVDLSADGQWVVFSSEASNTVDGDTNICGGGSFAIGHCTDVFLRDVAHGTTTRVSVTSAGGQANGPSFYPAVSADGRYVAFWSIATNLVPGDTNNVADIFVRDTIGLTTTRVSVSTGGVQGNDESGISRIAMTDDGRYVAFVSRASNLVPGDTNGVLDVFIRDLQQSTTERVSVGATGVEGNADSVGPFMSGDARFVTFKSPASNLASGATIMPGSYLMYLRDRTAHTTIQVTGEPDHAPINDTGVISFDGRYIAFNAGPVFVLDRARHSTSAASISNEGVLSNATTYASDISLGGRFVVFVSDADNLVAGDSPAYSRNLFLHDMIGGVTLSIDNVNGLPSAGSANDASLSSNGRYVAFSSSARNLVPNDLNAAWDVFWLDRDDSDGVPWDADNCPNVANSDQLNTDGSIAPTSGLPADTTVPKSDVAGDSCDLDIDNDGLSNAIEAQIGPSGSQHVRCASASAATSPASADSDGDRVIDSAECALGSDPMNPASKPESHPPNDTDGDGLPDVVETSIGSNPYVVDTDGDGIGDGLEYMGYGTSPTSPDSDRDGCSDGREIASVNDDFSVNTTDLLLVAQHFTGFNSLAQLDVTKDGRVNSTDMLLIAKNFSPSPCSPSG